MINRKSIKFGVTRRLSEFVVKTAYPDLPVEAIRAAKKMILDTVGCGVAGTMISRREVSPVLGLINDLGDTDDCSLWASSRKTSWLNAIVVNGTYCHSIDYDDTRAGLATHIGAVVVPTVLAIGEKLGASGKDILLAAVVAYEVVYRISRAIMPTHYHFWHSTGTNGTFGGAVATAKLLGLNTDQVEQTIGIAADQASGLISCIEFGDLTKSLHAGLTAAKGAIAAMLVHNGASGPERILEYERGYCYAFSKEPKIETIIADLGKSYDIVNNAPKFYPSVLGSHCAIAAALKIVKENDIQVDDIIKIEEHTTSSTLKTFCNRNPQTSLAAKLSHPYCVAVAVLDKEVGLCQFDRKRLADKEIRNLMDKIEIIVDPELDKYWPQTIPARIEITTRSGDVFSAEDYYPRGVVQNPMTDEELEHKFRSLCTLAFDDTRIEALLTAQKRLDRLENISDLTNLLAVE